MTTPPVTLGLDPRASHHPSPPVTLGLDPRASHRTAPPVTLGLDPRASLPPRNALALAESPS